ncbi:MAG: YdcF family protein [Lachnospiraceae bacterium]|nr:YdcF family protein [Lachnospiraceae bacterium]
MGIAEAVCLILGVLCLLYYLAILLYSGITTDFAWIWVAAGIFLLGMGHFLKYVRCHPGAVPVWVLWGGSVILLIGILVFLYLTGCVVSGMSRKAEPGLDYVIVLGAQVRGERPSRALRKRLDRAAEYARENPDTVLILSGGKGSGEDISEAECMYRYLTEQGIDPKRLKREDRSTSTKENLEFCRELYHPENCRTGLVSNNFHIYRALALARKSGYTQIYGIPASSDIGMQPHNVVREVFALAVLKITGKL